MEIKECILTKNDCYRQGKKVKHTKIVVHSTGANNPKLSRYVQPDDGILGDNKYNNDWNRSGVSKCVHAFIGKDKDGKVRIYQTLPWDFRCYGCGTGKKGSYNDNAIQFEICEDALTDEKYFNEAFTKAAELCEYLCKMKNIEVNDIVSHYEAYKLGYASNHGDCDHWLKKFGKDMDWFRKEVSEILNTPVKTPTTSKPTPAPSTKTKSLDDWAKEVINGKHGSGHAKREVSLKKAGCTYAYEAVRKRVNELCGVKTTTTSKPTTKPAKSLDDWAKEVINGKHGNGHTARKLSLQKAGCTYDYEKVRARVNQLSK